jgi:signal transduction histidine kinase
VSGDAATRLLVVCREAISNIARHARASEAEITVQVDGGRATLRVSDDGIGPISGPTIGHGLDNMATRGPDSEEASRSRRGSRWASS